MRGDVNRHCRTVERQAVRRIIDLPERHNTPFVRYKGRRVALIFSEDSPAEALAKEAPRQRDVSHGKSNVIGADRQRSIIQHSDNLLILLTWCPAHQIYRPAFMFGRSSGGNFYSEK